MGRKCMGRNGYGPKWLWAEMTSDHSYCYPAFVEILRIAENQDFDRGARRKRNHQPLNQKVRLLGIIMDN